jgi:hypothetical protein
MSTENSIAVVSASVNGIFAIGVVGPELIRQVLKLGAALVIGSRIGTAIIPGQRVMVRMAANFL